MSSETWEIIRKLRGDEIELQIAFQCAPLITGLKESNLLNIKKQDYQRMKDIFRESELTSYPLGCCCAGKRLWRPEFCAPELCDLDGKHRDRHGSSGSIFFQRKRAGIVA